jgi:hypothetical protein
MKKKILYISITLIIALGGTGCTDWLDLRPEGEMILDEFWQTESDAQSVLAAGYRGLIERDCIDRMMIWGEGRSDNFTNGPSILVKLNDVLRQEIEPTNDYTKWGSFYSVINYCNTFLKFAPDVLDRDDNFTMEKLNAMKAEAYTLRALSYFYLVRTFNNVPWISEPSIDDTQNYSTPQSTESAILDSLISDLTFAARYAKTQYENEKYTKGRITKNAVYALLADIYLWKNDYDNCVKSCDKILSDDRLELEKAENMFYNVFYKGNSTESIFELQFDDDVQVNGTTRDFYGYSGTPDGQLTFPAALVEGKYSPFDYAVGGGTLESEEDYRREDFIVNNEANGYYYIFKYAGMRRYKSSTGSISTYSWRSNTSNWIVYRLSDVILMKAEALLQRDGDKSLESVVSLVNKTYHRSNPDVDTLNIGLYTGLSDVETLVLRERQRELMFEGKRWFDLVRMARRLGKPTPVISYVGRTTSSSKALSKISTLDALYWPINKNELEANKLLKQNPFYETTSSTSSNK